MNSTNSTNPENHWNQYQAAIRQRRSWDLTRLPGYPGDIFLYVWRAFYENDRQTKVMFGMHTGFGVIDDLWVEMMQEMVDAGLAPTPEQVGARSPFMAWAHRLIGKTGEARQALMAAWSASLGERIEAAYARLNKRR